MKTQLGPLSTPLTPFWGWWASCTARRHVLTTRLLVWDARTFFNTCTKQEHSTQMFWLLSRLTGKTKHKRWAGRLTQTHSVNAQMQSGRVRGDSSPRALREPLIMRNQQSNVPLGMRSGVFDLLPVDHHDQQHDEAKKSESWHHHQGDNPHHPAHPRMRRSGYVGQGGPVWKSTMFHAINSQHFVFLTTTTGGRQSQEYFCKKIPYIFPPKSPKAMTLISMFRPKSTCSLVYKHLFWNQTGL